MFLALFPFLSRCIAYRHIHNSEAASAASCISKPPTVPSTLMTTQKTGRILVHGNEEHSVCPVISSDVSLSFWGGIDPETGVVIDTTHPLHGICVAGSILCLPSGRGSCTASQVLLELVLNGKAPKALVLRDRDGLICVGALVAQSVFPEYKILDIIQVEDYSWLLENDPKYGQVLVDGSIVFGSNA